MSDTRETWNAQLRLAQSALSSELLQWAEHLTMVARDTMLAELDVDTVNAWLKADGWYRRFWDRDGGTEWHKDSTGTGIFVNTITVPDGDDLEAKRKLIAELARHYPAEGSADATLIALLAAQEEARRKEATHATD